MCQNADTLLYSRLKNAVKAMKNESFVHGDLRAPNIMIRIEEIDSDTPTLYVLFKKHPCTTPTKVKKYDVLHFIKIFMPAEQTGGAYKLLV